MQAAAMPAGTREVVVVAMTAAITVEMAGTMGTAEIMAETGRFHARVLLAGLSSGMCPKFFHRHV
jgi:hypothetical protein